MEAIDFHFENQNTNLGNSNPNDHNDLETRHAFQTKEEKENEN